MGLTKKQKNILQNRLENVVDKTKTMIRNDQGFPSLEEVNNWIMEMLPPDIKQNKPAQLWTSQKTKKMEALFFYESEMVYVLIQYRIAFYKQAFHEFFSEIIFINDLYPEDFIRIKEIRRNLNRKFDLK